jgi:tRNA threonylcarbamoyladenosine biosynthesis protein TsaE
MKTNSVLGVHYVSTLDELRSLAERVAQEIAVGDVVLLSGRLGVGKTTFTQFLGKALGVQANITSPTYTLIGEYPVVGHGEIITLIHMDLYRMGQSEKVLPLSKEYIQDVVGSASRNRAIVVIEWAERLEQPERFNYWNITINPGATSYSRIITIS